MMKKALSAVLTASMTLAMCAVPQMATTALADDIKVGLVTDIGGVNDGSFNQSSWEGLQRAGEELGIEVNYLESKTDSDYVPNIESFMDDDYDLIICVGYMLADATRAAAEENPDQKFAIIDDSTNADLDNVACLMFHQEQASYLVGYAAGLTTKTNNVGFVIGMVTDVMNQFGYGYAAGAIDANPDVTIQQANVNSFGDPATGKTLANTQITNGADVIFHAGGASGLGVIEACQEAGIYAIGVDSDQGPIAPETVLTSALKRVDNAVYDTAKAVTEDAYEGGVKEYDLSMGGVDVAKDLLDEETMAKIDEVKEQIIAGDIVVPASKEDFEAAYGDVYELDNE